MPAPRVLPAAFWTPLWHLHRMRIAPNPRLIGLLWLAFAASPSASALAADSKTHVTTHYSRTFEVDQIYRSMQGPKARKLVLLRKTEEPELLWITGFSSEIVVGEASQAMSPEFMCHANLGLGNIEKHRELFHWSKRGRARLFTLSQGQMKVNLPAGFGIPLRSDEPLTIDTQVLNLNRQDENFRVRHRTEIRYQRDSERSSPMKPLFQQAAQGLVLIEGKGAYYNVPDADPEEHGPGCAVGTRAGGKNITDAFGREFSAHWHVAPGVEVNRTLVTGWMELPYDTTVHQISVHLHPFAESLELRDLTTGTTVYKSQTRAPALGIGLEHVDSFSSEEGVPVYADHEYELVSVYNNTTSETQDSMAVMFLYMLDKDFVRPALP